VRRRDTPSKVIVNANSRRATGEIAGIADAGITAINDVLLLFAGFASGFDAVTITVLERDPGVAGNVSTSVTVAEVPLASVPREQVMVDVPLQLP
jgi:hypothetical protein